MWQTGFFFMLIAGVTVALTKTPEEILTENDYIYQPLGYYMYVYLLSLYILFYSNKNGSDYSCYPYEVILDHANTFEVLVLFKPFPCESLEYH